MATTVDRDVVVGGLGRKSSKRSTKWAVGILAAAAMAAVTASALAVLWPTAPVRTPERTTTTASSLYTPQEQKVMTLAYAGVIPRETMDGGIYLIKRLINEGLLPRGAADPAPTGK